MICRKRLVLLACCMAGMVLLTACSRRGAQMPKHRKSRGCNCPSFSYLPSSPAAPAAVMPGTVAGSFPMPDLAPHSPSSSS